MLQVLATHSVAVMVTPFHMDLFVIYFDVDMNIESGASQGNQPNYAAQYE